MTAVTGRWELCKESPRHGSQSKVARDEGLPYYQAVKTTALIKDALEDELWDCVFPLDCDEFLLVNDSSALEAEIASLTSDEAGLLVSD